MIEPTVGRVVLYTPPVEDLILQNYKAPFAAIVTYVWGARMVNLTVFYPDGRVEAPSSVKLLQDGDEVPGYGRYAEWMPYQKGQAAKTEKLQAELDKTNV